MSDELVDSVIQGSEDVASAISGESSSSSGVEAVGLYPDIALKYKSGEPLSDDELDKLVDVALRTLRDLLGFFDAEGAPIDEYDGDDGELILDVSAPDLAVLIGRHGRTLDSFQSIFSLLVSRKLGFRYPFVVDIEGYKSRRQDKIVDMAHRAAARAIKVGECVSLQPMNAYERRLVHIALRDDDRVETHSEGDDPNRHVVVCPL